MRLGLDIGTSAVKAVLVDGGALVAEACREIMAGMTLADAADPAVASGADPRPRFGRLAYLENLVNRFS